MNINTAVSLAKGGKLLVLLGLKSLFTHFYRLSFYASMADTAILKQLAKGPVRIESLNGGFSKSPALRDATEAWLGLGVHLGLLKKSNAGYSLRGFLAKKLADPEMTPSAPWCARLPVFITFISGRHPQNWNRAFYGIPPVHTANTETSSPVQADPLNLFCSN